MALVRSAGCAALAGGAVASAVCLLLVLATWVAALGDRPGLRVAGLEGYPAYLRPLYEDPRRITTLALVLAITVTLAGLGLVRRREWGRKLTLGAAITGIAWIIAAVPVSWHMASLAAAQAKRLSPLLVLVNCLVALAVLALLVFLLWALQQPAIKDQFRRTRR